MCGQIAGYGNEDMPALLAIAPVVKLLHTSLKHLVSVKPCVFTQQSTRESRNQAVGGMA
jgi:hypothetical protein